MLLSVIDVMTIYMALNRDINTHDSSHLSNKDWHC